jgi:alkaline phosphatase
MRAQFTLLSLLFLIFGCKVSQKENSEAEKIGITAEHLAKPKNIILLIGDGMGLSQISALHQAQDNTSSFDRFVNIGFISTHSASDKITDSAAGATAFACGKKSYNGAISVGVDSLPIPNLCEILSRKNYSVGVVATSSITHATPACFYAHAKSRNYNVQIAKQLFESEVVFFAGGGREFLRKSFPKNKDSWIVDTSNQFQIPLDWDFEKRYGFAWEDDGLPKVMDGRNDVLTQATLVGIEFLSKRSTDGFFLMSEGSQIDWGGHANDYDYVLSEMKDFDLLINKVLDFAEKDGNTLVIVLADHETGGLALGPLTRTSNKAVKNDYNTIEPKFTTGGHTSALIPVFAYGPGSEKFAGLYDNTEIFNKIIALSSGK